MGQDGPEGFWGSQRARRGKRNASTSLLQRSSGIAVHQGVTGVDVSTQRRMQTYYLATVTN
jgi:hypothetical protein